MINFLQCMRVIKRNVGVTIVTVVIHYIMPLALYSKVSSTASVLETPRFPPSSPLPPSLPASPPSSPPLPGHHLPLPHGGVLVCGQAGPAEGALPDAQ